MEIAPMTKRDKILLYVVLMLAFVVLFVRFLLCKVVVILGGENNGLPGIASFMKGGQQGGQFRPGLGRRGQDDGIMQQHGIAPIDMVVVNLYPFAQTVAREGCSLEDAVENIDIGGPTMVRDRKSVV